MNGHGELKLTQVTPSDAEGYLMSAQDFWRGLRDLTAAESGAIIASGFLASQAIECTLKAYLSFNGVSKKSLQKIGHDLGKLWNDAHQVGFPLDNPMPHWVRSLVDGHCRPNFYFRYPLGLNGVGIPARELLVPEIERMIDHVYAAKRSA